MQPTKSTKSTESLRAPEKNRVVVEKYSRLAESLSPWNHFRSLLKNVLAFPVRQRLLRGSALRRVDNTSFDSADRTLSLRTARIRIVPTINPFTDTPIPNARMPARLGSYEVKRELGRGGMGVVYEGYDSKLRRSVALKVLKQIGPSDDDLLTRFQTEAEAVARLQHPHIVQVMTINDPFAYRFHAERLATLEAPSVALKEDWEVLRSTVTPKRTLAAVAGGMLLGVSNSIKD